MTIDRAEILPGENHILIDMDAALDEGVRASGLNAEGNAVLGEIAARQYAILNEEWPDRPDVAAELAKRQKIAEDRRRRADGIRTRAGVKNAVDLIDMRPIVAQQLAEAQTAQVVMDEKLAHPDLYAVLPEEAMESRDPRFPPPETAEQIRLNAMQGRARVQALREWLEQHPDGPDLADAGDPIRQAGVDAARKFYGVAEVAATPAAAEA